MHSLGVLLVVPVYRVSKVLCFTNEAFSGSSRP